MQTFWEDIQFAYRNFLKVRAVCVLIIVTLALGIGANAAIFSMVYNVLLAPLPFNEGDQLVKVKTHNPNINRYDVTVSVPTMFDYRNQTEALSHVVEYHQMFFSLLGHGDPLYVDAGVVSWDYFEMLDVKPILGRTFLPGEDEPGAKHLIVMSNHFWREKFNSDPTVIGMNLEMNDFVHEVIGVLPPLPAYPVENDIWVGAAACPGRRLDEWINRRDDGFLTLFGKIKHGVSLETADLEINTITNRLKAQYPDDYPETRGFINSLSPLRTEMVGNSSTTFYLLLGITSLVLLIACANVANLNLARTAVRKQELAVREALGANPRRIARQVLTESIILSLIGGALGLIIALLSIDLLSSFAARFTSLASEIKINGSVLAFCLAVSLLTGIISGATAAFQKRNINQALKEGSGNVTASIASQRLRQALLIIQFSLAFIILTSASLVSLSLYRLNTQDTGFKITDIIAVDMIPTFTDYPEDPDRIWFANEVTSALQTVPEIESVAYASVFPLMDEKRRPTFFQIEGRAVENNDSRPDALMTVTSQNYHQVLNIPLIQGRFFNAFDDEHSPGSALVNQSFAKQFFPNDDPVNQRISVDSGENWLTIRGVVGDIRELGIDMAPTPTFYTSYLHSPSYGFRILINSKNPLQILVPSINKVVFGINARQSITEYTTLQFIRDDWLSSSRLTGILVSIFALLAFSITLSGVIGVVAYNVSQRRKEVGIRVALGANPNRIRALFTTQGLSLGVIGIGIGALIMAFLSPLLSNVLFETNPLNPSMYFLTALLVGLVALAAILLPTRQATSIHPNEALREQ